MKASELYSPLYKLESLSEYLDIDLWVKRDDLLPLYLGGNKVRKNLKIISSLNKKYDVLITNGGSQSNHARVLALIGAKLGYQVELVLHGEQSALGNAYFYQIANANTHYVASDEIAMKIEEVKTEYEQQGKSVFIVPGGGHSLEAVKAYAEAYSELPFIADKVILASGTGGTQAGLIKGVLQAGHHTKIFGISVARTKERGVDAILKLLPENTHRSVVDFFDDYRFGGYEQYNQKLVDLIKLVLLKESLPLDTTYTGKAMYGLFEMVKSGAIASKERVVFWHTGGLFNLITRKNNE